MIYTIIGSHSNGAFTMDTTCLKRAGIDITADISLDQFSRNEVVTIANQLQKISDEAGYAEHYTVFDREMEIYHTISRPAAFYRVHYREDAMSNEQVIHEQFSDLDKAKEIAGKYPWWSIYRTFDYDLVAYQWSESTRL